METSISLPPLAQRIVYPQGDEFLIEDSTIRHENVCCC